MIPKIEVRGVLVNQNNPNGPGVLVTLTLFRTNDFAGIAPDPQMKEIHEWSETDWIKKRIKPCFRRAANGAFEVFWRETGGVRWLLTRDEVEIGIRGRLPSLDGPSLGAAFAVGLIFLQGAEREALVARVGLPLIVISAELGKCSGDDIRLEEVGGIGAKVLALRQQGQMNGIQALAVFEEQKDVDGCGLRLIKAASVKGLMNELAKATAELVSL